MSRYKLAALTLLCFFALSILIGTVYVTLNREIKEVVLPDTSFSQQDDPAPLTFRQDNPMFAAQPSWVQNFSGQSSRSLDPKYWSVLYGPAENSNKEQQFYSDDYDNLRIENGTLRLIATKGNYPDGYKYGSARLETVGKQTFLYGRMDIVAKLPKGTGTWPAVWMLPATDTYANMSPLDDPIRYRNGGEIDIIEAVGFLPNDVYGVVHTRSHAVGGAGSYGVLNIPKNDTEFNTYSLLWTPTELIFEVNGTPYNTYARTDGATYMTWPFDKPFYLIANVALGGTWGGMDTENFPGNGIDDSELPASMDIRSITYYSYIGINR